MFNLLLFPDSPLHLLSSPTKNGYHGHHVAALDDDTSDTLGDSIEDFIHARH